LDIIELYIQEMEAKIPKEKTEITERQADVEDINAFLR